MKKIVILSNHHMYTYNFRKEIIEAFLNKGHKVHLVLPYGEKVDKLIELGCEFTNISLDRRGKNIFSEIKLFLNYFKIIKKIKPDCVYTYTIKPNLYGGLVCNFLKIPFFPNITGLGSAFNSKSKISKIVLKIYKIALKNATVIFFQNEENKSFFSHNNLINDNYKIIPGSGINTKEFNLLDYPSSDTKEIRLLYIGRIMREKGIGELYEASKVIKENYPEVLVQLIGFCEDDYLQEFNSMLKKPYFEYLGYQTEPSNFIKNAHAIIMPSYHEGMSNVLLEGASSGRPVIASQIPGCKEIFDEGLTGFGFEPKNSASIVKAVEKFIQLNSQERKQLGLNGRDKVLKDFDRQIVVDAYLEVLKNIK